MLRALWAGETVTAKGRFYELDAARVRPAIARPGGLPIEVAGRGARLLEVVAAHADRWDVNLPPVAHRVLDASRRLESACRARGRDAASIGRSMWLWTRLGPGPSDALVRSEFRRWNPWFGDLPDAELIAFITEVKPEAVFVSCTNVDHVNIGYALIQLIAETFPELMIVAGGSAFARDRATTLSAGATYVPSTLGEAKEDFLTRRKSARRKTGRSITFSGTRFRVPPPA